MVKDYNGRILQIEKKSFIETSNVIWAAGVKGALIDGFDSYKIEASISRFFQSCKRY